jgi:hypothetical protein
MIKWMCDVIGNQPSTEEKIKGVFQDINSASLEKFIGERGNLPTAVKEKIKQMGYKWSDSGGGVDSWYLGVQFYDFIEACSYLSRMSIIFCSAVESGMLRFKLQTWVRQKGGKENDQGECKPNG